MAPGTTCSSPCHSACQLCGSREPGLGVFFWENQKAVTLLGRCEFMLRLYRCLALLVYRELVSRSSRRAQARLRRLGHGNRHSLEQKQERERCPAFDLRHFPDRKALSLQKSLPFSAHVLMMSQWRPLSFICSFIRSSQISYLFFKKSCIKFSFILFFLDQTDNFPLFRISIEKTIELQHCFFLIR